MQNFTNFLTLKIFKVLNVRNTNTETVLNKIWYRLGNTRVLREDRVSFVFLLIPILHRVRVLNKLMLQLFDFSRHWIKAYSPNPTLLHAI